MAAFFPKGKVTFTQVSDDIVVNVNVCGIPDGLHAFHIHEFGDVRNACNNAGPHYNPHKEQHGSPISMHKHEGDLGNVLSQNECVSHSLTMPGTNVKDLVGRGVVFHEHADDMGLGGNEESKRTGNAGPRIACAPIVIAKNT